MKPSEETLKKLYQNLGKLFYAIAAADKKVSQVEINTLVKLVNTEWLPIEKTEDEFGTDEVFQIEIIFDWLLEEEASPAVCMSDFKAFKKEHESLFTNQVKKLTWKTANAIASAFSRKNKSELVMLNELSHILKVH